MHLINKGALCLSAAAVENGKLLLDCATPSCSSTQAALTQFGEFLVYVLAQAKFSSPGLGDLVNVFSQFDCMYSGGQCLVPYSSTFQFMLAKPNCF